MKKTLATLPFHPTLLHLATGKPVQALTVLSNGSPVWPIMGGDGEGEGGEGGEGDGKEGEGKEGEGESKEGEGKENEGDENATIPKSEFDKLQQQFEALKNQLSASDRNKSKAEKALEDIERKKRTDLENAQKDLETEKANNVKLKGAFKNLALTNAFLTASAKANIQWHDPSVAQRAADLAGLEVNEETGEVTGIIDAVKKLAKDNAYLVNKGSGEGEGDEGKGNGKNGPSGSGVGSGGKKDTGKNGKPSSDTLKKRFPALRG